jgi:hypothetical protein
VARTWRDVLTFVRLGHFLKSAPKVARSPFPRSCCKSRKLNDAATWQHPSLHADLLREQAGFHRRMWLAHSFVGKCTAAKPSDLFVTQAASVTTRLVRNCQDSGVCEIRIDLAVGRAAGCSSLALLIAGESTLARSSIVVAVQAIPILASCDRHYASCQDGRRRRKGKKEGTHFSLPR